MSYQWWGGYSVDLTQKIRTNPFMCSSGDRVHCTSIPSMLARARERTVKSTSDFHDKGESVWFVDRSPESDRSTKRGTRRSAECSPAVPETVPPINYLLVARPPARCVYKSSTCVNVTSFVCLPPLASPLPCVVVQFDCSSCLSLFSIFFTFLGVLFFNKGCDCDVLLDIRPQKGRTLSPQTTSVKGRPLYNLMSNFLVPIICYGSYNDQIPLFHLRVLYIFFGS